MLIQAIRNRISPLRRLHRDERGDNENLGRLLLLALVLIPLIILITVFGGEIYDAAEEQWSEVMDSGLDG
jgi:hypothetical protein